jgi:hypothetical protein
VVAFLEGDHLLIFHYISVHLKSGLIRGVAFGGSDLIREVTFGGSDLIRGVTFGGSDLIREVAFGGSDLIREVTFGGSDLIRQREYCIFIFHLQYTRPYQI